MGDFYTYVNSGKAEADREARILKSRSLSAPSWAQFDSLVSGFSGTATKLLAHYIEKDLVKPKKISIGQKPQLVVKKNRAKGPNGGKVYSYKEDESPF
jgi:hypothetical protein